MNKIGFKTKAVVLLIACSVLNTGCFENKKDDSTQTLALAVAQIDHCNDPIASGDQLSFIASYNYFNGAPDYVGTPVTTPFGPYTPDNGNVKQGEYNFKTSCIYWSDNFGTSSVQKIMAAVNSSNVFYVQITAGYAAGQFTYYNTTTGVFSSKTYTYLCPDLSGYKNSLEETETYFSQHGTENVNPSDLSGGCFSLPWSRLGE